MKIFRFTLPFQFFFLLLVNSSFAQYFNSGQDKASIHWRSVQTANFEIIYPEGFEQQGKHVAQLLEKACDAVGYSLNHKPRKISVVLHTGTVKSNAFLGWCPGRIEMFTTPNQGIYSQDWLEQLTLHEYRHMVQISKLEAEMPQLLKYLFGEHAAALITGMYLPFWFIEGDAVAAETGLSRSGRGRCPDFNRQYKALLVEKGKFNYEKAYLGSFRDDVPNHYQMGYLMVAGARAKDQSLVWDSVLHFIARHPFSITAFDKGLKRFTSKSTTALYQSVFDDLTLKWKKEDSSITPTYHSTLSPKNRYYTNYTVGARLSDGTLFAQKTGMSDIDRFVAITSDGKEKVVFTPGYSFDESVTARDHFIVWSERLSATRWDHADQSLLRVFDVANHEIRNFRFDTKIFAPSISPDLSKAITVEADNFYRFYLSEIDFKTGILTKRYTSSGNDYFITPSYSNIPGKVLTVVLHNDQKGIVLVNLGDSTEKVLLPFKNQEIKRPIEHGGYVWFIGGYRGTDDLYAIDTLSSVIYRVITSRFGIGDYSFDEHSVIYADYTSDGFKLVTTNYDSLAFQRIDPDTIKNLLPFAGTLAKQEKQPVDFSTLDSINHRSKPYHKAGHLLNFHSWAPLAIDPYSYEFYPGVSFMSQNLLSTAETVLGYRYKWQDDKGEFYLDYKYMGWYPVIDVEADYGKTKSSYYQVTQYLNERNQVVKIDTVKKNYSWNEADVNVRVYLPLNFSKGKYYRGLYPSVCYNYAYYDKGSNAPGSFPQGSVNSVEGALAYYSILHQSTQDIYPEWGIYLDAGYMKSLSGVLDFGQIAYGYGIFYLPGFFSNHGIKLYGGYQVKNQVDYTLSDRVRLPRGYQTIVNNSMASYGIDYKLPLVYPDFNIGRLVFIKRINLGLFYDQAFLEYPLDDAVEMLNLRSTGLEVVFNTHFFRFFAPVDIGFRTSYLFDQSFKTDFLFNISFTL